MIVYRGKLISCPEALPRLLLRNLIHERIIAGPCMTPILNGDYARVIRLPDGTGRIERWERGRGWVTAPAGALGPADFMPGYCRSPSAKDAARLDIPPAELDNITAFEIELAKHEMNAPRIIRGFLCGRVVSVLPLRGPRAKIIGLVKERAWTLATRTCAPGNA
jgi:hypothetical protein